MLLWTCKYSYIFGIMISFLFVYTPTGGISGSYRSSSFSMRNLDTVFHSGCTSLHSHLQCIRIPSSLHPHQNLHLIFLILGILIGAGWYLTLMFPFAYFTSFRDLLAICMSSLEKCLYSSPILYLDYLFFSYWVVWVPFNIEY